MRVLILSLVLFAFAREARAAELPRLLDVHLAAPVPAVDFAARFDEGGGDGRHHNHPFWVAFSSFMLPGLGQTMNGQPLKALGFFLVHLFGAAILESESPEEMRRPQNVALAVVFGVNWTWCVVDAYVVDALSPD